MTVGSISANERTLRPQTGSAPIKAAVDRQVMGLQRSGRLLSAECHSRRWLVASAQQRAPTLSKVLREVPPTIIEQRTAVVTRTSCGHSHWNGGAAHPGNHPLRAPAASDAAAGWLSYWPGKRALASILNADVK